eukprot:TRINITY_DN13576_c2_g2_i3.p1 TRINITY_DN13576_c2_g2~~TRINITY_DN13576_c2_g2_i3.p1  ORF type:complete len:1471 (-),score=313.74 TRINITY_DN13576_c2_g2_i3:69-4481(-)
MSVCMRNFCIVNPGSELRSPKFCFGDEYVDVEVPGSSCRRETYAFDHVFTPPASQQKVFERIAKQQVLSVLDDFVSSLYIAIGATNSGKTFLVTGGAKRFEDRGLIPRSMSAIFEAVQSREDRGDFQVSISFYELYKHALVDLLSDRRRRVVIDSAEQGHGMANISKKVAKTEGEAYQLLFKGDSCRKFEDLPHNAETSRGHVFFCLHLEHLPSKREAELCFADLAAEVPGRTEDAASVSIARSLNAFTDMVCALRHKEAPNFEHSLLTQVLQPWMCPRPGKQLHLSVIIPLLYKQNHAKDAHSWLRVSRMLRQTQWDVLGTRASLVGEEHPPGGQQPLQDTTMLPAAADTVEGNGREAGGPSAAAAVASAGPALVSEKDTPAQPALAAAVEPTPVASSQPPPSHEVAGPKAQPYVTEEAADALRDSEVEAPTASCGPPPSTGAAELEMPTNSGRREPAQQQQQQQQQRRMVGFQLDLQMLLPHMSMQPPERSAGVARPLPAEERSNGCADGHRCRVKTELDQTRPVVASAVAPNLQDLLPHMSEPVMYGNGDRAVSRVDCGGGNACSPTFLDLGRSPTSNTGATSVTSPENTTSVDTYGTYVMEKSIMFDPRSRSRTGSASTNVSSQEALHPEALQADTAMPIQNGVHGNVASESGSTAQLRPLGSMGNDTATLDWAAAVGSMKKVGVVACDLQASPTSWESLSEVAEAVTVSFDGPTAAALFSKTLALPQAAERSPQLGLAQRQPPPCPASLTCFRCGQRYEDMHAPHSQSAELTPTCQAATPAALVGSGSVCSLLCPTCKVAASTPTTPQQQAGGSSSSTAPAAGPGVASTRSATQQPGGDDFTIAESATGASKPYPSSITHMPPPPTASHAANNKPPMQMPPTSPIAQWASERSGGSEATIPPLVASVATIGSAPSLPQAASAQSQFTRGGALPISLLPQRKPPPAVVLAPPVAAAAHPRDLGAREYVVAAPMPRSMSAHTLPFGRGQHPADLGVPLKADTDDRAQSQFLRGDASRLRDGPAEEHPSTAAASALRALYPADGPFSQAGSTLFEAASMSPNAVPAPVALRARQPLLKAPSAIFQPGQHGQIRSPRSSPAPRSVRSLHEIAHSEQHAHTPPAALLAHERRSPSVGGSPLRPRRLPDTPERSRGSPGQTNGRESEASGGGGGSGCHPAGGRANAYAMGPQQGMYGAGRPAAYHNAGLAAPLSGGDVKATTPERDCRGSMASPLRQQPPMQQQPMLQLQLQQQQQRQQGDRPGVQRSVSPRPGGDPLVTARSPQGVRQPMVAPSFPPPQNTCRVASPLFPRSLSPMRGDHMQASTQQQQQQLALAGGQCSVAAPPAVGSVLPRSISPVPMRGTQSPYHLGHSPSPQLGGQARLGFPVDMPLSLGGALASPAAPMPGMPPLHQRAPSPMRHSTGPPPRMFQAPGSLSPMRGRTLSVSEDAAAWRRPAAPPSLPWAFAPSLV